MTQGAQVESFEDIRTNKRFLVDLSILLASFIFCYIKTLSVLVTVWWTSEIYSHGFLVPVISLYLVWMKKDTFDAMEPQPNYLLGLSTLTVAVMVLLAGHKLGIVSIGGLSVIVAIAGIILLILGRRFLVALWLPVAYLLFMVPFWDVVLDGLHLPFQNFSAAMGVNILQAVGIPAFREDIFIELPNVTLEVAQVCSGVNNLIAVVAIAIPLAYIALKSWVRRFVLVSAGIGIAILFNGLRVALIGILSYYGMSEVLHGPGHVLQALSVSIVGFIVLFLGAWILSEDTPASSEKDSAITSSGLHQHSAFQYHMVKGPLYMTAGILAISGVCLNFWLLK